MCAKKTACLCLLIFAFIFTAAYSAEAHYLSIITNSGIAEVGETHNVGLSFTHVLPTGPEYGALFSFTAEQDGQKMEMHGEDAVFDVKYLYNDDTSTNLSESMRGVELNVLSGNLKNNGTVILSAACSMNMVISAVMENGSLFEIQKMPTQGFSKQILNAASDGWSRHTVGYDLEIVPLSDLAGAKVGDTIEFKVIFNNSPFADTDIEWADSASEVYMDLAEMGPTNLQTLPDLTNAQGVFSYIVKHSGLNALGVEHEGYTSSFIFSAAESSGGSGGSGGCDIGLGAFSLAGLAAWGFISRRKNRVI